MNHYQVKIPIKFVLLLLVMSWLTPAYNQDESFSELAIGVRQGYQFSIINFDPAVPQGFNQGFTSGLVLQYLSQKQLGFQMEINYSQRGWNAPEYGQPIEYTKDIDYLEIPFLTHFAIGKKTFRIVINAGSYLSYMIDARNSYFITTNIQEQYNYRIENPWTYGIMGDIGLAFRTRIGVFQATGRGANGFTDIFDSSDTIFNASPEIFWGGQFSYLYRFGQKKKRKEAPETELDKN